jgi:mono/diheme cytochrome c family protein
MSRRAAAGIVWIALAATLATGCTKTAQSAVAAPVTANVSYGKTERGSEIFAATCAVCHGRSGTGGIGPALIGERRRKNYGATVAWIEYPSPPMPALYPQQLSELDVDDVATYVQSL